MKSAFGSDLAAGIKACGEVFFGIFDADAVQCRKNGAAGRFFEDAV